MRIPFVKPHISAKEKNYLMEVLQRGQLVLCTNFFVIEVVKLNLPEGNELV